MYHTNDLLHQITILYFSYQLLDHAYSVLVETQVLNPFNEYGSKLAFYHQLREWSYDRYEDVAGFLM